MAIFIIAFDFDSKEGFTDEFWAETEKEAEKKAWDSLSDTSKDNLCSMEVIEVQGAPVHSYE